MDKAQLITLTRGLLDGDITFRTPTCLRCGSRVMLKSVTINSRQSGPYGISEIGLQCELAICFNDGCKQMTAAQPERDVSGRRFTYGRGEVIFVDGDPWRLEDLPQPLTPQQRAKYEQNLDLLTAA